MQLFWPKVSKFPLYRNKQPCDVNYWNYDEKRKWILYPYSSLHARLEYGFVHICLINHPAHQIEHLIFSSLCHLSAKPIFIGSCCGTIDRTLVINHNSFESREILELQLAITTFTTSYMQASLVTNDKYHSTLDPYAQYILSITIGNSKLFLFTRSNPSQLFRKAA